MPPFSALKAYILLINPMQSCAPSRNNEPELPHAVQTTYLHIYKHLTKNPFLNLGVLEMREPSSNSKTDCYHFISALEETLLSKKFNLNTLYHQNMSQP